MKYNKNKGITLIALVVTIIILLILAGISINMLTGQNGILNRAQEAKEKTEIAQEDENKKVQEYEDIINNYTGNLPTGGGTTPYLPGNTFFYKEGNLSTGLVIQDKNNNEYVWVEVPTTIYDNEIYNGNGANKPNLSTDWEKIKNCLKEYTKDYSDENYNDTNSNGIYTEDYKNMLKSIYENGGFWIGRYEVGVETEKNFRKEYTSVTSNDRIVIKPNMYPYTNVKVEEAQLLATKISNDNCTSSLIYGIQWDLILKYIETKNLIAKEKLNNDSTTIGNSYDSELILNRGKFAQHNLFSNWYDYNSEEKTNLVTGNKKQVQSTSNDGIILTTGSSDKTNLQNIYDIAGNVWEWTLEIIPENNRYLCRGGSYANKGTEYPASSRSSVGEDGKAVFVGFRIGLWK